MNGLKTEAPQYNSNKPILSAANINHQQNSLDDVVTINTLQAEYPHLFTKQQLSWLLKTRHKNGLDQLGAILKISRKLYIKKSIFIDWFLEQKANNS
ncbi:MAG: hypothetical protein WAW36_14010 [Methylovulum miyakonense]|uniref:hypothetical protein n=1 Tax=Methylovulum miyakonense TaxID=645578 RepID=UPI003BB4AB2A